MSSYLRLYPEARRASWDDVGSHFSDTQFASLATGRHTCLSLTYSPRRLVLSWGLSCYALPIVYLFSHHADPLRLRWGPPEPPMSTTACRFRCFAVVSAPPCLCLFLATFLGPSSRPVPLSVPLCVFACGFPFEVRVPLASCVLHRRRPQPLRVCPYVLPNQSLINDHVSRTKRRGSTTRGQGQV